MLSKKSVRKHHCNSSNNRTDKRDQIIRHWQSLINKARDNGTERHRIKSTNKGKGTWACGRIPPTSYFVKVKRNPYSMGNGTAVMVTAIEVLLTVISDLVFILKVRDDKPCVHPFVVPFPICSTWIPHVFFLLCLLSLNLLYHLPPFLHSFPRFLNYLLRLLGKQNIRVICQNIYCRKGAVLWY